MFAVGEDKKAKKKGEDEEETGKDETSHADIAPKASKSTDADGDKPASGAAASQKSPTSTGASPTDATSSVKPASQTDAPGSKSQVKTASHETDDDDAPSKSPPPSSGWSFWKLFKIGGGDVSGNKEP